MHTHFGFVDGIGHGDPADPCTSGKRAEESARFGIVGDADDGVLALVGALDATVFFSCREIKIQ